VQERAGPEDDARLLRAVILDLVRLLGADRGRDNGRGRRLLLVEPMLVDHGRDERLRGDVAALDEDLAEAPAGLALDVQRLLELAPDDEPALDEVLAERTPREVGLRHAAPSGVSRSCSTSALTSATIETRPFWTMISPSSRPLSACSVRAHSSCFGVRSPC